MNSSHAARGRGEAVEEGSQRVRELGGGKMLARLQDKEPKPPYELVVVHKRYQPHLHILGREAMKGVAAGGRPGPRRNERRER